MRMKIELLNPVFQCNNLSGVFLLKVMINILFLSPLLFFQVLTEPVSKWRNVRGHNPLVMYRTVLLTDFS